MITVRFAEATDTDAISRIAQDVQGLHAAALPAVFQPASISSFSASDVNGLMVTPNQHLWVGLDGPRTVGYLYAEVQRQQATRIKLPTDRLYIHQMGVLASDRGRGIGTALLRAARTFAAMHGLTRLALDVWAFNVQTRSFYEREGFKAVRTELWSAVDEIAGPVV